MYKCLLKKQLLYYTLAYFKTLNTKTSSCFWQQ